MNFFASALGRHQRLRFFGRRAWQTLHRHGALRVARKSCQWLRYFHTLSRLRREYRDWLASRPDVDTQAGDKPCGGPLVSVLMPIYRTPPDLLREAVASVTGQTYPRWELCVVAAQDESPELLAFLQRAAEADSRIRILSIGRNDGISAATNVALDVAIGEYVAFLDHDDTLAPAALESVARCLATDPTTDLVYTDEDHITEDGRQRIDPMLKPDWSPETLLQQNYLCHLVVVRRALAVSVGGLRSDYDGAQDWDFLLRIAEHTDRVRHVPQILYHWRLARTSTASSLDAKPYARDAQRRALQECLRRRGVEDVEVAFNSFGLPRLQWPLRQEPLVSIIILAEELGGCPAAAAAAGAALADILDRTAYAAIEIIWVTRPGGGESPRHDDRVRSIPRDPSAGPWSARNRGAQAARGQYLLFLDPHLRVTDGAWLTEMLRWAQFPQVGVVGASITTPHGRVRHAGLVIGLGGPAGFLFQGTRWSTPSHFGVPETLRNVSAVGGACQLVSRDQFLRLDGYDEAYESGCADWELCLRIGRLGYRSVVTPEAVLTEIADAPGGLTPSRLDLQRFARFLRQVGGLADPYFHPELSAASFCPELRRRHEDNVAQGLARWLSEHDAN